MAYKNWVIGGLTPSWVEPDFKDDPENRTLTLKCAAISTYLDDDPITEIDTFREISSENIFNDAVIGGGTNLQVGPGGHIFSVTATNDDGSDIRTWSRCALKQVILNLDEGYCENKDNSVIEYELVIVYEVNPESGSFIYTSPFTKYSNIEYYLYTDKTNPVDHGYAENTDHGGYGNEMGYTKITEEKNVKKIEVYGCGDCGTDGTDCWVEVNGERKFWHFTDRGDKRDFPGNNLKIGFEKFEWVFDTPTNEIVIQTSTHIYPDNTCQNNKGCWLLCVKAVY